MQEKNSPLGDFGLLKQWILMLGDQETLLLSTLLLKFEAQQQAVTLSDAQIIG